MVFAVSALTGSKGWSVFLVVFGFEGTLKGQTCAPTSRRLRETGAGTGRAGDPPSAASTPENGSCGPAPGGSISDKAEAEALGAARLPTPPRPRALRA